jgi:hypothetical protein
VYRREREKALKPATNSAVSSNSSEHPPVVKQQPVKVLFLKKNLFLKKYALLGAAVRGLAAAF